MVALRRRWLLLSRVVSLFIIFFMMFSASSSLITARPVAASGWAGWGAINTIYFNSAQEDAYNPYLATAATELQTYLGQMSGRSFTITHTYPAGNAVFLSVNATQLSTHGDEAFRLVADINGVTITGKTALAVREGAYYLLYKLGERFFFKSDTWTVTPTSLVNLGALDEIHEPSFNWREVNTESWGTGAAGNTASEKWNMRNMVFGAANYVVSHSYNAILTYAGYTHDASTYAAHPGWFLPTGGYQNYPWQLNPENADVIAMTIAYARHILDSAPGGLITGDPDHRFTGCVSVTPNDGSGFNPPYATGWTNAVYSLANAVAANISEDYPGKLAGLYCYAGYSDIPTIELEPNILVEIATSYNYSGMELYQQIEGLVNKGIQVGIRDYLDIWQWTYGRPGVGISIAKTLTWYASQGIKYYNGEGGDAWCAGGGLTYYLVAKMLYDPTQNVDDLLDDFYTKAFGPAATVMKHYYQTRATSASGLATSFRDLDEAETLAAGNAPVLARIRQLEDYGRYMWKFLNIGVANLSTSDLEDFYTFITKTRDLYVIFYKEVEPALRTELYNRGLSSSQVDALQNFTPPTPTEDRAWLDEALTTFSGTPSLPDVPSLNPFGATLTALGDNITTALTPPVYGYQVILVPSTGNENVTVTVKGNGCLWWYYPTGLLIDKQSFHSPTGWTPLTFEAPTAGTYILYQPRSDFGYLQVDVPNRPAAIVAEPDSASFHPDGEGLNYDAPRYCDETATEYFYVPTGTDNFTFGANVENEGRNAIGKLTDKNGIEHSFSFAVTDSMTITSPTSGLWKIDINMNISSGNFWLINIMPLVWNDPRYLLVPAVAVANAPPVLDPIGDKVVHTGQQLQFTVSATDPNNDPLIYSASNLPPWATFNPATRTFSGTANQTGTYTNVQFTVSDGALTDSENITITVGNLPPVLADIGNKSTHTGWSLQFTVSATDPNGDNLTYSASNLPPWASFTPAMRAFSGTANQTGTYPNVQFSVSDGDLTDSENITITVTANQAPVLSNPGNKSVNEGTALNFTVSATDPDSDPLTYSASNVPSGATFTPATRTFLWTPSYSQAGTYANVHFSVTDSQLTDSENITITVNNVNRAPVLNAIGNKSVTAEQQLTFTVSATDPDGDSLTYSANNTPAGASFNGTTRVFTWTPASSQVGSYANVRFAVTDGALTAFENITITVEAIPPNPPSGGGGGGGGGSGGGGGGGAGITNLRGSTTVNGLMVEDVSATDIYLKVELRIPKGAIVKNRVNQALTSIIITPQAESQAASSGSGIISQSYAIEPSGATFAPSANLIFRYSSLAIPADTPVSNLYIAVLDPDTLTWTDLGGTINADAGTITVPIIHLSTYALMAHNRPASLKVTKFNLTPGEVAPGETVNASIEVNNQGDLSGTYQANLTLDNAAVQTRSITLNGGSSETIVFTMTSDTVGEHKASLGDMVATFVVKKPISPATFTVSELNLNPLIADSGKNVGVNANVKNTGDLAGTYQAILSVDDVAVGTKEVALDGGGTITVSFSFTADAAGQHKVSIGGLLAPFEVKSPPPLLPPPAATKVSSLQLDSFNVDPGYDKTTNTLVYVRIAYQMNQTWESFPDASLRLTVFRDSQFLEQVPLLTLNELQTNGQTGELSYVPTAGWETGEYAFRAELYDGDRLVQDTPLRKLTVTPESTTTVVSWKTLGIIIGAALALGSLIVTLVLYYRRDMLRDYWK